MSLADAFALHLPVLPVLLPALTAVLLLLVGDGGGSEAGGHASPALTRARRIAKFVAMLANHEKLHP